MNLGWFEIRPPQRLSWHCQMDWHQLYHSSDICGLLITPPATRPALMTVQTKLRGSQHFPSVPSVRAPLRLLGWLLQSKFSDSHSDFHHLLVSPHENFSFDITGNYKFWSTGLLNNWPVPTVLAEMLQSSVGLSEFWLSLYWSLGPRNAGEAWHANHSHSRHRHSHSRTQSHHTAGQCQAKVESTMRIWD